MAARQNIPAQLRLKEIQIQSLKGISNCTITFPADRKVTAIMGMNGSGKSTIIHALACCYKPRNKTSKENNRFSDFFTPHDDNNWRDSGFTAHFYAGNLTIRATKFHLSPQQHRMIPLPKCMPKSVAGSQYMHDVQSRSRSIWVCKR